MLGLSGKRHTDWLTVNPAELGTQVSFARAAGLSRQLAGTTATAGQAHHALADTAALRTGAEGTLGPGHPAAEVVQLDGTGARAGTTKNGVGVPLAIGLTGRSGPDRRRPDRRRRAHPHLLGLTVGQDWSAMAAQLAGLGAPALIVLDDEPEITTLVLAARCPSWFDGLWRTGATPVPCGMSRQSAASLAGFPPLARFTVQ